MIEVSEKSFECSNILQKWSYLYQMECVFKNYNKYILVKVSQCSIHFNLCNQNYHSDKMTLNVNKYHTQLIMWNAA